MFGNRFSEKVNEERLREATANGGEAMRRLLMRPLKWSPMTLDEIKAKLGREDNDSVQAVLALLNGMKVEAEEMLVDPERSPESAEVWRGQLKACLKLERLMNGVWAELEEDAERQAKSG